MTERPAPVRFDVFQLDVAERRLSRDGVEIALTPKAFDLLALLVERAGRLVRKEELLSALWPDVVVTEANLTQTVFVLRKALGENEERRFIETVPRAGYRFVAPVAPAAPAVPVAHDSLPSAGEAAPPVDAPAADDPGSGRGFANWFLGAGTVAGLVALYAFWPAVELAPSLAPAAPGEPTGGVELAAYRAACGALERGDAWLADRTLATVASAADEAPLLRVARLNARLNLGDEASARRLEHEYAWGDVAEGLPEADRLWLEATRLRARDDNAASVAPLERLFSLDPAAVQVGARLAGALVRADRTQEADLVVARLRQLAPPVANDPQIDLVEAQVAYQLGDPQRSLAAGRAAAAKLAAPGSPALLVSRAGQLAGIALMELGRFDEADDALAGAAEAAESAGIRGEAARAWRSRGFLADRRGRLDEAATAFERALAELVASGDAVNAALTRADLGGVAFSRGRFAEAIARYDSALQVEAVSTVGRRRMPIVGNAGWARLELGESETARELLEEHATLARDFGNPASLVYAANALVESDLEAGDVDAARTRLDEAERQAVEFGAKEMLAYVELARSRTNLQSGDAPAATAALRRAREISAEVGAGGLEAQIGELEAALAAAAGRCADAAGAATAMAADAAPEAYRVERASALAEAARCRLAERRLEEAGELLGRARAIADATDSLRARLRVDLVDCQLRLVRGGAAAAAPCASSLLDRARGGGFVALSRRIESALAPALRDLDPPPAPPRPDARGLG